jgi:hypothetical protein
MRFQLRHSLTAAAVLGLAVSLSAQTVSKPAVKSAAKPVSLKSYCHPEHEFCFKYPAAWTMLGEVFEGNGVAVAPASKQPSELRDAVTVALVVPAPEGDEEAVTIEETIAQAVAGMRKSGQSFETLQRQQRTVDGKPAEMVKLHYKEQETGREWIEELVFIEGPNSEIYSVALKTAPASLPVMEPQFQRLVESWKLPQPAPPPGATDEGEPAAKPKAATTPSKTGEPKPLAPPKP